MRMGSGYSLFLILGAVAGVGSARADIDLRINARPIAEPIEVSALVDAAGEAVTNLSMRDVAVTLDGKPFTNFTLTPPRSAGEDLRASIALIAGGAPWSPTDYATLISSLRTGDMASIVTYRTRGILEGVVLYLSVMPFTEMDGGQATNAALEFLGSPPAQYGTYRSFGGRPNMPSPISFALNQFNTPPVPLPPGIRMLVGGTGVDHGEEGLLIDRAIESDVALFDVATLGTPSADRAARRMMLRATGGELVFGLGDTGFETVNTQLASWINDSYQLVIPADAAGDCDLHTLEVTLRDQSVVRSFVRCDATPDPFDFGDVDNAALGATFVSEPVTVTGIESPAEIEVIDGEYSIGCGSTFTREAGFIQPFEEVCVRHTASASGMTERESVLVIGGEWGSLRSLTMYVPPTTNPPPTDEGTGGGGLSGLAEILLLLVLLWLKNPLGVLRQSSRTCGNRRAAPAGRAVRPTT